MADSFLDSTFTNLSSPLDASPSKMWPIHACHGGSLALWAPCFCEASSLLESSQGSEESSQVS